MQLAKPSFHSVWILVSTLGPITIALLNFYLQNVTHECLKEKHNSWVIHLSFTNQKWFVKSFLMSKKSNNPCLIKEGVMLIEKVPIQSEAVSPAWEWDLCLTQDVFAESWSWAHLTPMILTFSRRDHGTHKGLYQLTQDLNYKNLVRCEEWGRVIAQWEEGWGKREYD